MKKLFSLIVILVAFSSCQDEVKFNDPGFQAFRDDVLFKAVDVKAYKSTSGTLRIVALALDEEVELKITSSNPGTYVLGTSESKIATYINTKDNGYLYYKTGTDIGDGEVKITDNNLGTVTGTFRFNARNVFNNPLGGELVNFQYGAFYKIPLIPEP